MAPTPGRRQDNSASLHFGSSVTSSNDLHCSYNRKPVYSEEEGYLLLKVMRPLVLSHDGPCPRWHSLMPYLFAVTGSPSHPDHSLPPDRLTTTAVFANSVSAAGLFGFSISTPGAYRPGPTSLALWPREGPSVLRRGPQSSISCSFVLLVDPFSKVLSAQQGS